VASRNGLQPQGLEVRFSIEVHRLMSYDPSDVRHAHADVLLAPSVTGLPTVPEFVDRVDSWCRDGASRVLAVDLPDGQLSLPVFCSLVWARQKCLASGRQLVLLGHGLPAAQPGEQRALREFFTVLDDDVEEGSPAAP
jgi:hypothetical protein